MKNNIKEFLEKRPLILPVASAILLVASSYPFDLWPLSIVALAPYFYFIYFSEKISLKTLFFGGFLFGFIVAISLSYFSIFQFHWLPETYLFVWAFRFAGLPISLVAGLISGIFLSVVPRFLRINLVFDIFTTSVFYALAEYLVNQLFFGYNLARISYPLHNIPFVVGMASIGGVILSSFMVALVNAFVAAFFVVRGNAGKYPGYGKKLAFSFAVTFLVFAAIYSLNYARLNGLQAEKKEATFAVIQFGSKGEKFGEFKNGNFEFPELQKYVLEAQKLNPDFIVYPFSLTGNVVPFEERNKFLGDRGIIIKGSMSKIGDWLKNIVSSSTVFVSWNNVVRDGIYGEVDFWQDGKVIQSYNKRNIFPFIDYTPEFSKKIGLYTVPINMTPGPRGQVSKIGDLSFNTLICSEITSPVLAREGGANILISPGSEAVFRGSTMGYVDLVSAQFRAAENYAPAVRANRFGPSALIDSSGMIVKKMDYDEEGILLGKVGYQKNGSSTLYSRWGDAAPVAAGLIFLAIAAMLKMRRKEN